MLHYDASGAPGAHREEAVPLGLSPDRRDPRLIAARAPLLNVFPSLPYFPFYLNLS